MKIKATMIIVLLMTMVILPVFNITQDVKGVDNSYNSESVVDGFTTTASVSYSSALTNPAGFVFTNTNDAWVGQQVQYGPTVYSVHRTFFSFDTSGLPDNANVVKAKVFVCTFSDISDIDFDVNIGRCDYGSTLNPVDATRTPIYEGTLLNTVDFYGLTWYSVEVSSTAINTTGRTQYKIYSGNEGTAPTGNEYIKIYTGDSLSYKPYLEVVTESPREGNIIYNISTPNANSRTLDLTYNYTREQINITEGFESGDFVTGNWTTFGSPVVTSSYSPYNGLYHAGASILLSGASNHTFERQIDFTDQSNISISYYRKTIQTAGTTSLIVDWYNGTGWKELENITGNNIYDQSSWLLPSDANNNSNVIFRFNVTLTGSPNNGGWIDDIRIWNENVSYSFRSCDIPPAYIQDYNSTYEILKFEVFVNEAEWIITEMDDNNSLLSFQPCLNYTWLGCCMYNLTNFSHNNIWFNIWFLRPKFTGSYNHSTTIYPKEILEYNTTHELLRYEFNSLASNWINISVSGAYLSISPNATIIDYGSSINITEKINNTIHWIWFTREKALVETTIHIALSHATLGEGFFWEKWQVVINDGTGYDNTTASRVWNPDHEVNYGETYTITVLDWFTPPNHIVNKTFMANTLDMDIQIDIPVFQLNLKSFRTDTTAYAIYFNSTGEPYQSHLPSEEWFEIAIREGTYMFRFDYLDSISNGSSSVIATAFFNLTLNATYTINIGENKIDIIITDIEGNEIKLISITNLVTGPIRLITEDTPIAITDPRTRSSMLHYGTRYSLLGYPFAYVEATVYQNESSVTTSDMLDVRPSEGDVTIIEDQLTLMSPFGTTVLLNYTNGTNFLSVNNPTVIFLDSFNVHNFTIWASNTSSFIRKTHFQQASVFSWEDHESKGYIQTTLAINNTTPFDWVDAKWMIPVAENTVLDSKEVMVYDQTNNINLTRGENYTVDSYGFYIRWGTLSSGSRLPHTFTYYTDADDWIWGIPEISIISANLEKFMAEDYWHGSGTWSNPESADYNGEIRIYVENLDGEVDQTSIFVTDENENTVSYSLQSTTKTTMIVSVPYSEVGIVEPGESRTYEVHFQYSGIITQEFPWLMYYATVSIIMVVLGILTVASKKKDRPTFGLLLILSFSLSTVIGLIAWAFV